MCSKGPFQDLFFFAFSHLRPMWIPFGSTLRQGIGACWALGHRLDRFWPTWWFAVNYFPITAYHSPIHPRRFMLHAESPCRSACWNTSTAASCFKFSQLCELYGKQGLWNNILCCNMLQQVRVIFWWILVCQQWFDHVWPIVFFLTSTATSSMLDFSISTLSSNSQTCSQISKQGTPDSFQSTVSFSWKWGSLKSLRFVIVFRIKILKLAILGDTHIFRHIRILLVTCLTKTAPHGFANQAIFPVIWLRIRAGPLVK